MGLLRGSLALAVLVALAGGAADAGSLRTNRAKALVSLDEIIPGGPPPDGIPAIDRPTFVGGGGRRLAHRQGALSALDDAEIATSRPVGATAVFSTRLGDLPLTFEALADGGRDRLTGSRWTFFGVAVSGQLVGQRLTPIPHVDARRASSTGARTVRSTITPTTTDATRTCEDAGMMRSWRGPARG